MLRLREAIDENTLIIIQKMFMQYLNSSTALYEADGSIANSIFEGKYCSFLNEISSKNAGTCQEEAVSSGKWICHEDCWRVSKESMGKKEPLEKECSGGINIYAVPIFYKGQVIGSINAGVTNPPLIKDKLEAVAAIYRTNVDILIQNAYAFKRLTNEEMEIARMQIRMASLLISSLYEAKVNQLKAEEETRRKNKLIIEKSLLVEQQKKQLEVELENLRNIQRLSVELLREGNIQALYDGIIDSAMMIMCSEYASMQILYDESDKESKLKLLGYRGFTPNAVRSWEWVDVKKTCTSCSQAVRTQQRVIVSDVQQCDFMKGSIEQLLYTETGIYAVQSTPLISRNGKVLGVISTHWTKCNSPTERQLSLLDVLARQAADVIERKMSEEALSESEERYRTLFEHMNEGFFLAEIISDESGKPADYRHLVINKALHKVFNDIDDHIIGKTSSEVSILPGEWTKIFGQVAYNGKPAFFESHSVTLNRHFLIKVFSPKSGQFACLIQDITESKNQSQLIRQQKEQLEIIMENMKEALFVFDKDGKYILINKSGRKWINGEMQNAGDSYRHVEYFDLEGNKILFEDTPNYHILHGRAVEEKIMLMKSPDKAMYISVSGSPIFDEDGNLLYGVIISRNVSDNIRNQQMIKLQQELLLKAEKEKNQSLENAMKMKDEFLATISHEFKTPLTVINAALQSVESIYGNQISDNIKRHLQRIRINSYRQLRLVNNLLDITRYNAGHVKFNKKNMDIVFLTKAIVKSVDLYAKQKGLELEFTTQCDYMEIGIDEEKYERIMLNLLSNSIKFTPKGKAIHVCLSCDKKKVAVSVRDEGIGIPKGKLKIIFERFGQVDSSLSRQAEGTGIGLSLVKALLTVLGGTITVESEIGKGTTFNFTLPAKKVKRKNQEFIMSAPHDSRIMQAAAIEFSDIYMD